jgi:hypothetical protein
MIRLRHKGDFSKTEKFLKDTKKAINLKDLDRYGKEGVQALMSATPVRTGLTANSWYYEIVKEKGVTKINFCNSNIQNGVPVAIILQYGHGTRQGGWVEGKDYINPAIQPVFDKIADDAWREVTKQ